MFTGLRFNFTHITSAKTINHVIFIIWWFTH